MENGGKDGNRCGHHGQRSDRYHLVIHVVGLVQDELDHLYR